MSPELTVLRPVARPAGPATLDGDRPGVLVEIRILLRTPGDAMTAARDLVEGLAALLDGAPRLDDRPAHATTGTGDADRRRLTRPVELVAVPVGVAAEPARTGLVLRPVRRTALLDGAPLALTRREYDLLLFLAHRPDQALGREQLLREVWGYGPCLGPRTVDVHVSRLRHKLAGRGPVITTVHGIGYRLDRAERLRIAAD
ncbi:winged helix-turn-helix transcriptional regulator [Micromonospora musae]|uniref:winged helix-turn-helix transcriptional regulator n=1 Tax=Micromonospora musae TaxID=1894970 RepID=UPI0034331C40